MKRYKNYITKKEINRLINNLQTNEENSNKEALIFIVKTLGELYITDDNTQTDPLKLKKNDVLIGKL